MSYKREYKTYELKRFKRKAREYLMIEDQKKTMKDLCDHLGITRQTLSKYKARNEQWLESIIEIKYEIYAYNMIHNENAQGNLNNLQDRIEREKEKGKERLFNKKIKKKQEESFKSIFKMYKY